MTNKEIVDNNLQLIQQCIDCQFAKLGDRRFKDDFQNDLIVTLLTYDEGKLNDAMSNNHLNALITSIIINNIWSKTSPYYAKYRRFEDRTTDMGCVTDKENGGEEE